MMEPKVVVEIGGEGGIWRGGLPGVSALFETGSCARTMNACCAGSLCKPKGCHAIATSRIVEAISGLMESMPGSPEFDQGALAEGGVKPESAMHTDPLPSVNTQTSLDSPFHEE